MPDLIAVLRTIPNVKVIDESISYNQYTPIDLSAGNPDLAHVDSTDAVAFERYIENYLHANQAKVAFGGYLEKRSLYQRSNVFKNDDTPERNIHIGLDLWIKAGTTVLAALDGSIHSFQDNKALGDYGPTIILEHDLQGKRFYTLYGHLSPESLHNKSIGQVLRKGEILGSLGSPPINGDYAPHLHFQLIKNLEGKSGDYPGVCSAKDLAFYAENCPDPNILLKIT